MVPRSSRWEARVPSEKWAGTEPTQCIPRRPPSRSGASTADFNGARQISSPTRSAPRCNCARRTYRSLAVVSALSLGCQRTRRAADKRKVRCGDLARSVCTCRRTGHAFGARVSGGRNSRHGRAGRHTPHAPTRCGRAQAHRVAVQRQRLQPSGAHRPWTVRGRPRGGCGRERTRSRIMGTKPG